MDDGTRQGGCGRRAPRAQAAGAVEPEEADVEDDVEDEPADDAAGAFSVAAGFSVDEPESFVAPAASDDGDEERLSVR